MRATEVKTQAAAPPAEGAQPMKEEEAVEPSCPTSGIEDKQEVGRMTLRFAWLPVGGRGIDVLVIGLKLVWLLAGK